MRFILCLLLAMALPANADTPIINGEPAPEIEWDVLMPPDYVLSLEAMYNNPALDTLDDYSDKAQQLYDEMMQTLASAPVVDSMNGKMVSVPGFVVPLEGVGDVIDRFFLVPYFGACIHVPPPPSNQIIDVHYQPGTRVDSLYDAVLISGRLTTEVYSHELGTAGYRLEAYRIQPYEMPEPPEPED
ncbi:DUF3299 domain-containing protein [Marinobacterium sp. AK62]|uniref:DUF3299 domain-containing protein n=1 Tax=Marinobacterium alkalitolerans TaxID=1542925 RepID=A0ABS3ZBP2_9GAMM|nr:DUF3299 domain-containing protein [Marinobacterium alkalitolerans]MBP0049130.1 DUF3299 domain-containing protein [Marinobacterium alkalitolerans]